MAVPQVLVGTPTGDPTTNVSAYIDFATLVTEDTANQADDTATFEALDIDLAVTAMVPEGRIRVVQDGKIRFNGFITNIEPAWEGLSRRYRVSCTGISSLLDKCIIPPSDSNVYVLDEGYASDRKRIRYLLDTFGTPFQTAGSASHAYIQTLDTDMQRQKFSNLTLRQAIERVLGGASESANYYVDTLGRLHTWDDLHEEDFSAPYAINTTNTPSAGEVPPGDLRVLWDTSDLINYYYVRGKNAQGSGPYADTTSTSLYGRRQAFIDGPDADTRKKAGRLGRAALHDTKNPIVRCNFRVELDYCENAGVIWQPGQMVTITSPAHGMTGYEIRIIRVTTSYLNGLGDRSMEIECGALKANFFGGGFGTRPPYYPDPDLELYVPIYDPTPDPIPIPTDGTDGSIYVLDDFERLGGAPYRTGSSTTDQQNVYADDTVITLPDGIVATDVVVIVMAYSEVGSSPGTLDDWTGWDSQSQFYSGTPTQRLYFLWRLIDGTEGFTGASDSITLGDVSSANHDILDQFWSYAFILKNVPYLDGDNSIGYLADGDTGGLGGLTLSAMSGGYSDWTSTQDFAYVLVASISDFAITGSFTDHTELLNDSQTGLPSSTRMDLIIAELTPTDSTDKTFTGLTFDADGAEDDATVALILRGQSGHPKIIASADTDSTGTSHTIALPDGSDTTGLFLMLMLGWQGTSENLGALLEADGTFTEAYGIGTSGTIEASVCYRRIDGTEGWAATGATASLTNVTPANRLYCHAVLLDGAPDLPTEGAPITSSADTDTTIDSLTPTDGFTEWVSADPARYFSFAVADAAVSGDHTDYDFVFTDDDASNLWAVASTYGDTSGVESPSPDRTFTGTNQIQLLIAVRGDEESTGWGSTLLGYGVDTNAPWLGGNTWLTSGDGAIFSLSGDSGRITLGGDDRSAIAYLSTDEPDDPSGEPWGPWSEGRGEFLFKWKVNPTGDTADTNPNRLAIGVYSGSSRNVCYINLGDAVAWSYMDPDQQQGITLATGPSTYSAFTAKTIAADTDYYTRIDFRGDTLRARLWDASATEPTTWDATLTREVETGLSDVAWLRLDLEGNDGMVLSVANIDAALGADTGAVIGRHFVAYGDGTTTTFTDGLPFVAGTLTVWVDNLQIVPTSYDGGAGTWTFSQAPDGDPGNPAGSAVIEASYQVA